MIVETEDHSSEWKRTGFCVGIAGALTLLAAYGVSREWAESTVALVVSKTEWEFMAVLLSRFSAYPAPHKAMLGIMVSWLTSPLTLYAGYLFTRQVIHKNIAENVPKNTVSVLFRILLFFAMAMAAVYTVVALPGLGSIYCRHCERDSMLFMLSVSLIGFWCAGALFGIAVSTAVTYITRRGDSK